MRNLSEQSYDFSKELNENKFNLLEQIVLLLHYFIKWRRKKCSIFQPQEQLTMLMISAHWAIERSSVDKIELSALNEGLHNSDFKTRKEKKDANNTLA